LSAEGGSGNPRKRISEQNKTFTRAFRKSDHRLSEDEIRAEAHKRQKETHGAARAAEMTEEEVALEKLKGLAEEIPPAGPRTDIQCRNRRRQKNRSNRQRRRENTANDPTTLAAGRWLRRRSETRNVRNIRNEVRNKSNPKHGAVPQKPSGRQVRVEWV
jgi:hypothetical protein